MFTFKEYLNKNSGLSLKLHVINFYGFPTLIFTIQKAQKKTAINSQDTNEVVNIALQKDVEEVQQKTAKLIRSYVTPRQ